MSATAIAWCDYTLNPFPGCRKVSPGCEHCYAEWWAVRLAAMGSPDYVGLTADGHWTGHVVNRLAAVERELARIPSGHSLFWESMGDLFYDQIPVEYLNQLFRMMMARRDLVHLVLTKRAGAAAHYFADRCAEEEEGGDPPSLARAEHIWLGTTIEDRPFMSRLAAITSDGCPPQAFLSCEPLLGKLSENLGLALLHNGRLRQVIVGCERLPGNVIGRWAGEDPEAWWAEVRRILAVCRRAGVACFVKQGPVAAARPHRMPRVSEDPADWPEDCRVQELAWRRVNDVSEVNEALTGN